MQLIMSTILLVLLFGIIDLRSFLNRIGEIQFAYYAVGLLFYLLAVCISALRWQVILRTAGESIGILQLIAINFIGSFFSIFLPTAAGGDLARMYESSRQGTIGIKAVSTVLLDRVIGLMSLVIISMLALLVGYHYTREWVIVFSVIGFSCALTIAWWLFFNPKTMRRFKWVFQLPLIARGKTNAIELYQSLYGLHNRPNLLLSTLTISFFAQVIDIASVIFAARALGIQAESFYFFIFIPLIWLVTQLPISLNGLGLREGAFVFFFGQIGVTSTEAVALSILVYSCRLLAGVLGGCLFLWSSINDSIKNWLKRSERIV